MKIFSTKREFLKWFSSRKKSSNYTVTQVPFTHLREWKLDSKTGNIHHTSGKFFSIEGLSVKTNFGPVSEWDQPIINQPEVGILGIITKRIDRTLFFLMQAKMEPGNVNLLQLSPTVQATKSNYTRVHKGKLPLYLDYFLNPKKNHAKIIVDLLQPEQGGRFYKKQNRNMIIEVDAELSENENFCWMPLKLIKKLLEDNNVINMNTRTVISCLPDLLEDTQATEQWLVQLKKKLNLSSKLIPLNQMKDWEILPSEISHKNGQYFSVIGVEVSANDREVIHWYQPIIKDAGTGLIGFIKHKNRYLVQAKLEPGNRDKLDLAPTVSFSNYKSLKERRKPPFFDLLLKAKKEKIVFDSVLSEEGGRFYHTQNRYIIIESHPLKVPENFIWLTVGQMKALVQKSLFNIEARTLIATL